MFYRIAKAIMTIVVYFLFAPRVIDKESFPSTGGAIVYSNHTSNFDPVILGIVLPRPISFMAKAELFQNPIISWVLKGLGAFPIKRGQADIASIKKSLQILRNQQILGIFPEGTRNKSGSELGTFANGIASIAHKAKVPVVPVAIKGGYKPFKRITVTIGQPIYFDEFQHQKSSKELLDNMSSQMENALKEML
ncbi:lysophospholipid acyltransferase family protein [Xylanivirga thermophila]|uniref:lysophospholipid acyltransferase family protein n=1 Tax=Xylanivirga thermophila TaxID=2496273 RepID=UPI00101BF6FD|nr:lysophospholipid acyltransferase family protein [Xylanivirga thermophila]